MNDEAKNKIAQLAFEAAKNLNYAKPKENRKVIKVSEVKITPEMEIEPEDLEVLIPRAEKHKNGFLRILLKTEFEDNTEHIYQSLCRIKCADVKVLSEIIRKNRLKKYQYELNIATMLSILKNGTNGVYLKSSKLECKLPNSIKNEIEANIEEKYKSMELDFSPMTFEEGYETLEQNLCEDVHDFIDDYWIEYANELGLDKEEIAGGWDYDEINDEMVERYIYGLSIKREITIEQISNKIQELTEGVKANTKRGAQIKNEKLIAAISLFTEYKKKLSNKDFRTIYECCDYFKLIDDSVKKGWSEISRYPEIKYIASIYNQSKKYRIEFDELLPF